MVEAVPTRPEQRGSAGWFMELGRIDWSNCHWFEVADITRQAVIDIQVLGACDEVGDGLKRLVGLGDFPLKFEVAFIEKNKDVLAGHDASSAIGDDLVDLLQ
ncbi:hypothetical protein [Ferrimicrobium sp.]|uniref:hypothetical protein n=1 Tax=Ferrimicrobium sp. TaxID=2926050 RepID=UPI002639BDE0|nr:hypothetical protein [Ferrimicrobium sp.]